MADIKIREGSLKVWVHAGAGAKPTSKHRNPHSTSEGEHAVSLTGAQHKYGDDLTITFVRRGTTKKYTFVKGVLTSQVAAPLRVQPA